MLQRYGGGVPGRRDGRGPLRRRPLGEESVQGGAAGGMSQHAARGAIVLPAPLKQQFTDPVTGGKGRGVLIGSGTTDGW